MANGVSKNPSHHTDVKNVNLILVKNAPKKVLAKKCFANWKIGYVLEKSGLFGQNFFLLYFLLGQIYIFEISIIDEYFLWTKKSTMQATTQYTIS